MICCEACDYVKYIMKREESEMPTKKVVKYAVKAKKGVVSSRKKAECDLPKFDNSDILLEDAIKANGGKLEWADTGILSDTSW